ncbi:MAG TPA: aminotransferase class I/II-fold pyridoxal phosphate-dependent enzyme [Candidatus Angelobacter sp.]|nr:aminotransferase class I/II-fold pyridoxal phosphate-dependent enzyme [Candidatus Angelobacter sp.]
MQFQNFDLEYYQSQFERTVECNLADSSVECVNIREWLTDAEVHEFLQTPLFYPEVNGFQLLRRRIAALYPKATEHNILVTVGASQANSMVCTTLLEAGNEVIVVSPGYRQVWGIAKNLGCNVKELHLDPDNDWAFDPHELESLVTDRTKLISIVNPNNPTGAVLPAEARRQLVQACERTGAWLHVDEVYCGTELDSAKLSAEERASFWGAYDKVICVHSMSKAYGMAGLRIGWAVAAPEVIETLWRRHEYAVIATSGPSMKLAEIALQPEKRKLLLDRQRKLSREGHALLEDWIGQQGGLFSVSKAVATSVRFVRYHFDTPSLELAEHLRKNASLLIAPGIFLGAEHHLRIAVGYKLDRIKAALDRLGSAAAQLQHAGNLKVGSLHA